MTAIIALAALGSWSYAGFLEEPGGVQPAPQPPAHAPAPAPETPSPSPPRRPEVPEAPPAPPPLPPPPAETSKAPAPRAEVVAPPAAPARYRLADASGQVWEHPDPGQLRSFVEGRNRSFAAPAYYQAATVRYSSCANGRCR